MNGPPTLSREDLISVATFQKGVLYCILAYILLVGFQFAIPPEGRLYLGLIALGVIITATVFVFLLATKVYSTCLGIVLGILTLIPCLGLIVLLIINAKATGVLKQNGIRVGLLGANTADIR